MIISYHKIIKVDDMNFCSHISCLSHPKISTTYVLNCYISKHIKISVIYHNVELQTGLQQFSNFTNEHK